MAFYKLDGDILEAPNYIISKNYELYIGNRKDYSLPIDGWYFFETKEEAYTFFGVELPKELPNTEGNPQWAE